MGKLLVLLVLIAGCGPEVAPGGCAQGVRRCHEKDSATHAAEVQECQNGGWVTIDDCSPPSLRHCTTAVTNEAHCEKI